MATWFNRTGLRTPRVTGGIAVRHHGHGAGPPAGPGQPPGRREHGHRLPRVTHMHPHHHHHPRNRPQVDETGDGTPGGRKFHRMGAGKHMHPNAEKVRHHRQGRRKSTARESAQ